jgi:hypothetical protein
MAQEFSHSLALQRTAQSRFSSGFRVGPSVLAVARPGFPGLSLSLIRPPYTP